MNAISGVVLRALKDKHLKAHLFKFLKFYDFCLHFYKKFNDYIMLSNSLPFLGSLGVNVPKIAPKLKIQCFPNFDK